MVHVGHTARALYAAPRSPVRGDDSRDHGNWLAHPHLLDGVHARGERQRIRALLLLSEPVRLVHAGSRPRGELPGNVRRMGRGDTAFVPVDWVLVPQAVVG